MDDLTFTAKGQDECWSVAARDYSSDRLMLAMFYGPGAGSRAQAYANWMNDPAAIAEQVRAIRKELSEIAKSLDIMRSKGVIEIA